MRKNILVFLVLLVLSISLVFHPTTSLTQTAEKPAQSEIEEKAARIYSNLSTLSVSDRKEFYTKLTPDLKNEIWKVQLRSYLSKHPELTDKQRQAIESLIAFSKPQVYEIPQDSPSWEEKVNKPVQSLTERILEVFPREVAKELLTVLGGSESAVALDFKRINFVPGDSGCASTMQETNSWLAKKEIKTLQPFKKVSVSFKTKNCNCSNKKIPVSFVMDNCDCSIRSDWCPQGTVCESQGCSVRQFCGTLGLYICDGNCFYYPCTCD